MRIALINPPTNCRMMASLEPLGLCYIGAVCQEGGHEVRIHDLVNVSVADLPQLFSKLDHFRPDLVGLTAMTENYRNALELSRAVKARYGCPVVMGGWHVSGDPTAVLEPSIDVVVRGEGEETILELLEFFAGKERPLSQIEGIAYAEAGQVRLTSSRQRLKHLTHLPPPLREGLPMECYVVPQLFSLPLSKMRSLSIQASRGCPYKCVFCQTPAIWSNQWVSRPAVSVVDEIEDLIDRYGINTLFFRDEEFTLRPRWVLDICEELKSRNLPRRLTWGAYCRVDDFSIDLAHGMAEAGCVFVFMGIEATTEEECRNLKKFYQREEAELAFRVLRQVGIIAEGSWIIGFPWDTPESLESAFRWILTLDVDFLTVLLAAPFHGTPLRNYVEENRLLLHDHTDSLNVNEPSIRTPHIPLDLLQRLPADYRRRFYLRSTQVSHVARQIFDRPGRARIIAELMWERLGWLLQRGRKYPAARLERPFVVPEEYLRLAYDPHVPTGERTWTPARPEGVTP